MGNRKPTAAQLQRRAARAYVKASQVAGLLTQIQVLTADLEDWTIQGQVRHLEHNTQQIMDTLQRHADGVHRG